MADFCCSHPKTPVTDAAAAQWCPSLRVSLTTTLLASILLLLSGCVSAPPDTTGSKKLEYGHRFMQQGIKAYHDSQYLEARGWFTQAQSLYSGMDHPYGIATSALNLTDIALALGLTDEAQAQLALALPIIQRESFTELNPQWALRQSAYLIKQHQYDKALETLYPYIAEHTPSQMTPLQLSLLTNKFIIAQEKKSPLFQPLLTEYEQAIEQLKTSDKSLYQARLIRFKAQERVRQNSHADVTQDYIQALSLVRASGSQVSIADTLTEWGYTQQQQGKTQHAQDILNRALRVRLDIGNRSASHTLLNTLIQLAKQNADDKALKHYSALLSEFE